MKPSPPDAASSEPTERRLATYFCPECGHESPVDGDWIVRTASVRGERRRRYRCPQCRALVLDDPTFEESEWSATACPTEYRRITIDAWTAACRRWSAVVTDSVENLLPASPR